MNQFLYDLKGYDYCLLDYSHSYVERPELFTDYIHLNTEGARIFSQQLAQDLEYVSVNGCNLLLKSQNIS